MSNIAVLKAEAREKSTKGAVRDLRDQGKVPAVIYGNNKPSEMISVDAREFNIILNKGSFFSRTLTLDFGKNKIEVLPQDLQVEPAKDKPLHIDFIRVEKSSKVKVSIPVKFINKEKSPGLKRGGILNAVRRSVEVICAVENIPDSFIADVGAMKIKDNVKFSDLNVPKGVEPVINERDFTVATIAGRVKETEATETAEATEGEEGSSEEAGKAEE